MMSAPSTRLAQPDWARIDADLDAPAHAVIFAVNLHPVPGKRRGMRRATLHHGVSTLHRGRRHTLGVIFHDAT